MRDSVCGTAEEQALPYSFKPSLADVVHIVPYSDFTVPTIIGYRAGYHAIRNSRELSSLTLGMKRQLS